MKFLNRITPVLSAAVVFILLQQLIMAPKQIYWLTFLMLAVIVLSLWQLTGRKLKNKKLWQFIITPLLLLASGVLFLSFLEGKFLKQVFLLGLVILNWSFLEVIFLLYHFRAKYQAHSLENISSHLNLVVIFLTASSFFSLMIFLAFPPWLLVLAFAIFSGLLTDQLIWANGLSLTAGWPYVIVIVLAATEIFWTVSFLPTSVYVNGLIVTIAYYLMTGISRNWLLGIKQAQVIKRYALISIICLTIILVTAKWF